VAALLSGATSSSGREWQVARRRRRPARSGNHRTWRAIVDASARRGVGDIAPAPRPPASSRVDLDDDDSHPPPSCRTRPTEHPSARTGAGPVARLRWHCSIAHTRQRSPGQTSASLRRTISDKFRAPVPLGAGPGDLGVVRISSEQCGREPPSSSQKCRRFIKTGRVHHGSARVYVLFRSPRFCNRSRDSVIDLDASYVLS
jgi:hypothetical protein